MRPAVAGKIVMGPSPGITPAALNRSGVASAGAVPCPFTTKTVFALASYVDAGALEAGKLADIVLLNGDPRADIANTFNVVKVMANGTMFDVQDMLAP